VKVWECEGIRRGWVKYGACKCVHGARGKSDGERGRNDLQVGHMTLLLECARSHIRCDRS
jgi:hypothetical protein